jgi:phosphate-selective porin OprO/OprP
MQKTLLIIFVFIGTASMAQTSDDILNLMIKKNLVSQEEADSIRAEAAIKAQDQKSFPLNLRRPVNLTGYTQFRFQSLQESGKPDYADIRRARLDFRGNVTPLWEYRLQVDFATTPKLLDGYAVFKPYSWLKFQAGQFKIPFTAENLVQSNNLETIERSQVVDALAARRNDVIGNQNGRDAGIQISGSVLKFKDRFIVDYFAGGFNGTGINVIDNNESKDFIGRIVIHPVKNLDIGASYYNGYGKYGTDARNHTRKRTGGDITYIYTIALLRAEYINGQDGGIDKEGYYATLGSYIWKKKLQLLAKYDVFDPDKNSDDKKLTNYTGGINFYFNDWSKIQLNYTYRDEESGNINNDIIAAQLQISF